VSATLILLNIIGGICLLLWGLKAVRNGVTRAFGSDLYKIVALSTKNRILAFASGMGVTALLQSSTATGLIVASFCGRGVMSLSAALAVILGADVGTTLVAQALSFNLSWLGPLSIFAGYVLFKAYHHKGRMEYVGKTFVGLGLMLFALAWIKQSFVPLNQSEVLREVLHALANDSLMAILVTALLTWLVHSSLAVVLLLVTMVTSGALEPDLALAMVLGANLGGVIAPLASSLNDSRETVRVLLGNLLIRIAGVALVLPLVPLAHAGLALIDPAAERLVVNFHTGFNLLLALTFLPLTGYVAKICTKLLPDRKAGEDPGRPKYLDERELDTPSIALTAATRETLRLAEIVQGMLEDTLEAMKSNDEAKAKEIRNRDDVIDDIYKAIKMYMARLDITRLDEKEHRQYSQIIGFSTNLENAGDLIDKSMIDMTLNKIRQRKFFSDEGWQEILSMHATVHETVKLAQSVFLMQDRYLARRLVESKDVVRKLESHATKSHLGRIREGVTATITTSALHLDLIRDYRRINSYMASVAYAILEETGDLEQARLKPVATS